MEVKLNNSLRESISTVPIPHSQVIAIAPIIYPLKPIAITVSRDF